MVDTTEYKNPVRLGLIAELKKAARAEDARLWGCVAESLSKSRKNRPEVNIHSINNNTSKGDVVVVPGKVIGSGRLSHNVDVAAFKFTEGAREEITKAGGRVLTIEELIKENSTGSGVKILS